jgi:hypothetical protein
MKSFILKKTNLFFFLFLVLLSTFTTQAQVAINTTGASPAAGSMLDVSSTNTGVLIPRVAYSSISSLTVQGLLVFVTSGGPDGNGFYFYDSGWKKILADVPLSVTEGGTGTTTAFTTGSVLFAGAGGVYSEDNSNFFWNNTAKRLGIGTSTPVTDFELSRSTATVRPAILVAQTGSGDASFRYYLNHNGISSITTGIDDNDNHNFKISDKTSLTGTTYPDANTLMRIHTETGSEGITDINHQSRARAYLSQPQAIPNSIWTPINFDLVPYDEHGEFLPSPPPPGAPGTFIANEDGYYQVNARTEFEVLGQVNPAGYVSIAIYVNGQPYAVGNNLQIGIGGVQEALVHNNAPNVSDVVYLNANDKIEIWVYQDFTSNGTPSPPPANILPNTEITYVSIHKVS